MLRSSSLVILAFLFVLGFLAAPSSAQEKLKIGFALPAYQGADADIAAYSYEYWVLEGLKFFEHEREDTSIKTKDDQLEWKGVEIVVENLTSTNASAFADAYYSLVEMHQVDVVIGPVTEAYTLAAIEGLNNASRVVPILTLSATPAVLASSPNLMTLIPPEDEYVMATEWLPAFQEFLGDRKLHLYSILALGSDPRASSNNGSNSSSSAVVPPAFSAYAFLQEELDFVRAFAVNVYDQLTNEPDSGLVYTVQNFTWFSSFEELGEQVTYLARVRPRPEVVLLATLLPVSQLAGGDPTTPAWSDDYLYNIMAKVADAGLEPGALYLPVAVDLPDERDEPLRKKLRSVCYNALWADTLQLSGGLGSAEDFRRHFEDLWGHRPSEWAAAGAAHALLAQLWIEHAAGNEWTAAQRVEIKKETFYANVEIDTSNGTNRRARVQFAQYRGGESRVIGDDGPVSGLSYRGRWEWVDYSLEGSAIAAIVIASILAAVALGLGAWSVFKFVRLFINPPENEDEDEEDEDADDAADKKK
jgi:hypothetical protein